MNRLAYKKGSAALYILLLAAVLAAMVALRQCSTPRIPARNAHLAGGDTLNVAIQLSPLGVTTEADTLSGTYYNLLRRISAKYGQPMRFHPFTRLQDALAGLDAGRYRMVVSDIPVTTDMLNRYIFVDPLGVDRQVLIQRRDSAGNLEINSPLELAQRRVMVPVGSPFIPRIQNLAREIGDTIIIVPNPVYDTEQLIVLTALGEAPPTVAGAALAAPYLKRFPQLDGSVQISLNQFRSWILAPTDTVLRDSLNCWLSACQH